jgi:hypothetical protein
MPSLMFLSYATHFSVLLLDDELKDILMLPKFYSSHYVTEIVNSIFTFLKNTAELPNDTIRIIDVINLVHPI